MRTTSDILYPLEPEEEISCEIHGEPAGSVVAYGGVLLRMWARRHELAAVAAVHTAALTGPGHWFAVHRDCRVRVHLPGRADGTILQDDARPEDTSAAVAYAVRCVRAAGSEQAADRVISLLERLLTLWHNVGQPGGSPLLDVLSTRAQLRARDLVQEAVSRLRHDTSRDQDRALILHDLLPVVQAAIQEAFELPSLPKECGGPRG